MTKSIFIDNLNSLSKTQSVKAIETLQIIFTRVVIDAIKLNELLPYEQFLLQEALEEEIPYQVSAYEERYKRLAKNILLAYGIIYNHNEGVRNFIDPCVGLVGIMVSDDPDSIRF